MNKVDLFALALRDSLNLHARLEYIEPLTLPGRQQRTLAALLRGVDKLRVRFSLIPGVAEAE
jgi:hypothetical protein